jgi:5-methylcytosine-specific restriction endonuclease McrBC regulatory subunit McrC
MTVNSLVPDIVVQSGNSTYIFDAKYKGHLDDIDERQWIEANEDIRADHRHDVHQVLAYSSIYGTENVTAVLVYPIRSASWQRLVQTNNVFMKTQIVQYDRNVQLILTGVPLQAPDAGFGLDVVDL